MVRKNICIYNKINYIGKSIGLVVLYCLTLSFETLKSLFINKVALVNSIILKENKMMFLFMKYCFLRHKFINSWLITNLSVKKQSYQNPSSCFNKKELQFVILR